MFDVKTDTSGLRNFLTECWGFFRKHCVVFFFGLTTLIALAHNQSVGLWDQDEAAYAGFARNIIETGDWLIPNFAWSEIHRKPPLHFWNIALCSTVFGVNEFSVRFPSVCFVLLTYLAMFLWGRKRLGYRASFFGVFALSTSFFVPFLAKVSVTDATLLFFSTLCALCMMETLYRKRWAVTVIFWLSFAMALLTKGPPIIIFSLGFAGILFLMHPNRKRLFGLHPWFFLPLSCLPLFTWGYMASSRDGGAFVRWLIDWYIFKRINGSVLGQTAPPGAHLLLMVLFFLPYTMFIFRALRSVFSGLLRKASIEELLLGCWFIAGWLPYEFSPSKLPSYVVVAHIPLALLLGRAMDKYFSGAYRPAKGFRVLHVMLLVTFVAVLLYAHDQFGFSEDVFWTIMGLNLIILGGVWFFFKTFGTARFLYGMLTMNFLFTIGLTVVLLPQLDEYKSSTRAVARFAAKNAVEQSVVIIANETSHPPSLPYYLGKYFDEIVIGETQTEQLLARYLTGNPCVLILSREQKNRLIEVLPKPVTFKRIPTYLSEDKNADYYVLITR